jgi:hypothetical protein
MTQKRAGAMQPALFHKYFGRFLMSLSMYQSSVSIFVPLLQNLKALLEKAAAYCDNKKIDPGVLPASRLFPDMFPLAKQVQIATDHAKGCPARLAGLQPPAYEDNEKTLADLIARVQKTLDYLGTFNASQIDGSEGRNIELKIGSHELKFIGDAYVLRFALPNFYFHVTTAYNILRHNGVEIGKQDFLGHLMR